MKRCNIHISLGSSQVLRGFEDLLQSVNPGGLLPLFIPSIKF